MVEFKPISLSPSSSQTSQEETPAPAIPREARGPTNPRRAPSTLPVKCPMCNKDALLLKDRKVPQEDTYACTDDSETAWRYCQGGNFQ